MEEEKTVSPENIQDDNGIKQESDNTKMTDSESGNKTQPQERKEKSASDFENRGSIGTSIFVQGDIRGNLNMVSDKLADPTVDYPENSLNKNQWRIQDDIDKFAKILEEQKVLLIYSLNSDAADAASLSVLLHPTFSSFNRRYLSKQCFESVELMTDGNSKEKKTTENGIFNIDNLLARRIEHKEPTLIFAEVQSRSFLESISVCSPTEFDSYVKRLSEKKSYIILNVCSPGLVRYLQSISKNLVFSTWEVSRLSFILHQTFDVNDAITYEEGILKQNEKNLWGESLDENKLAENISFFLSKDKKKFIQKYHYNQEVLEKPDSELSQVDESALLRPSNFLSKQNDPVTFHLAFIGACFERITVGEFDMLAYHLLSAPDKKVVTGKKTKRTVHEISSIKVEDEEEVEQYKRYIDLWKDEPDEFRRRAHLQRIMPIDSSHHYIEFSEPHLRSAVKEYFENEYPTFVSDSFDILFRSTFLNLDAGKNLIDNLVRLNAGMARQDPTTALQRLKTVLSIIRNFEDEQDEQARIRVQNATDDLKEIKEVLLFSLFQKSSFQKHKNEYFQRIYLLLSEFWNDQVLIPAVEQFLQILLQNRLYESVHFLVYRFWNAQNFTPLEWIKQLFERGDEDAKSRAFNLLLHTSQQELSRSLWEYINEIYTWLPDKNLEFERFSRTNEYGLSFLFHFVFNSDNQADRGKGAELSLFAPFFVDTDNGREHWSKLLAWLYHPCLSNVLYKLSEENEVFKTPGPAIAYVLDTWFWQLHGREEAVAGKTEEIIEEFFVSLGASTNLTEYRNSLKFLRIRMDMYRDQRSERERYYVLRSFIKLFIDKNPFSKI